MTTAPTDPPDPRGRFSRPTALQFDADGVVLHGWACGEGPPVLMLHAGRETSDVWRPVAAALAAAHHCRCVAIDQRGHGASGGVAERLADLGDDVARVLAFLDERCIVVGASLGGMAIVDALRHPHVVDRVRRIVLVDVVPAPDPRRVRPFLAERGLHRRDGGLIDDILGSGAVLHRRLAAADPPVTLVRATDSPLSDREVDALRRSVTDLSVTTIESDHLVARHAPHELARVIGDAIAASPLSPPASVGGPLVSCPMPGGGSR